MNFRTITLHNLFCYYGTCLFDLTPDDKGERNIIIIQGRNGHGKTSLLNSIKLLFGGVTEDLRRSVRQRRRSVFNVRQYVCGYGNEWWGILNHRARMEEENICYIEIRLETDIGEVVAGRRWDIKDDRYERSSYH